MTAFDVVRELELAPARRNNKRFITFNVVHHGEPVLRPPIWSDKYAPRVLCNDFSDNFPQTCERGKCINGDV